MRIRPSLHFSVVPNFYSTNKQKNYLAQKYSMKMILANYLN